MKTKLEINCKYCGKLHDPKEVVRKYGKDSMVSLLSLCTPQCYTKKITNKI